MVSLVLVSHSKALAEGLRDMVVQVAGESVRVGVAGGTADGRLGTNTEAIGDTLRASLSSLETTRVSPFLAYPI